MNLANPPLVTVIIPAFNPNGYLVDSIESILKQTYTHLEVLVIDDGSTDGSTTFLMHHSDSRLTLVKQMNGGKSTAMNRGIEMARGKYMLLQDADDVSHPNRVEVLLEEMERHPHLGIVFSGYDMLIDRKVVAPTFSSLNESQCASLIAQFKMPGHDPTIMVRMDIARKFLYDTNLRLAQGLDFILRIGEKHAIKRVGRCLYTYRITENSATRKNVERRLKYVNQVLSQAHLRRGQIVPRYLLNDISLESVKVAPQLIDNNIAAHFIDSVIDFRASSMLLKAILTGLYCAKLQPFTFHYYKALIYALVPSFVISFLRKK